MIDFSAGLLLSMNLPVSLITISCQTNSGACTNSTLHWADSQQGTGGFPLAQWDVTFLSFLLQISTSLQNPFQKVLQYSGANVEDARDFSREERETKSHCTSRIPFCSCTVLGITLSTTLTDVFSIVWECVLDLFS